MNNFDNFGGIEEDNKNRVDGTADSGRLGRIKGIAAALGVATFSGLNANANDIHFNNIDNSNFSDKVDSDVTEKAVLGDSGYKIDYKKMVVTIKDKVETNTTAEKSAKQLAEEKWWKELNEREKIARETKKQYVEGLQEEVHKLKQRNRVYLALKDAFETSETFDGEMAEMAGRIKVEMEKCKLSDRDMKKVEFGIMPIHFENDPEAIDVILSKVESLTGTIYDGIYYKASYMDGRDIMIMFRVDEKNNVTLEIAHDHDHGSYRRREIEKIKIPKNLIAKHHFDVKNMNVSEFGRGNSFLELNTALDGVY